MQRGQVPRGSPEIHSGDATAIKGCQRDKDETLYPLHGPHDELSDERRMHSQSAVTVNSLVGAAGAAELLTSTSPCPRRP